MFPAETEEGLSGSLLQMQFYILDLYDPYRIMLQESKLITLLRDSAS